MTMVKVTSVQMNVAIARLKGSFATCDLGLIRNDDYWGEVIY